jgi:hypothetical protein
MERFCVAISTGLSADGLGDVSTSSTTAWRADPHPPRIKGIIVKKKSGVEEDFRIFLKPFMSADRQTMVKLD